MSEQTCRATLAVYRASTPVAITFRSFDSPTGAPKCRFYGFLGHSLNSAACQAIASVQESGRFRKPMSMTDNSSSEPVSAPPRRWRRRAAILIAVTLPLLLVLAPRLLTHTPLRSSLLKALVGKRDLVVQAEAASGGWLEPLSFRQVSLRHRNGSLDCTIGRLQTNLSLLQYLFSPPDSAAVSGDHVSLTVNIDEQGRWPTLDSEGTAVERVRWAVTHGTLVLTVPWRPQPLISLQELTVNGQIEPDQDGHRRLEIAACRLLDKTPLDDSHAQQNLALVAPVLSQTTGITGSASLTLEAVRIPLDGVEEFSPFPLRGTVVLHQFEASLTPQILQQVTSAVGRLPLTLPAKILAPRNSRIPFAVTAAGIQHTEMAFGFRGLSPLLQVVTSGVLRLDETISLQLRLRAGWTQLLQAPFRMLTGWILHRLTLQATGTVDSPELKPADPAAAKASTGGD